MTRSRTFVFFIIFSTVIFLFGFLTEAASISSGEKETELEGKWESIVKGLDIVFTFSGNDFSVKTPNPVFWYKGKFVLHPDKDPKQIAMSIKDSGIPAYKDKTSLGIFKFEDDILILVMAQPGSPDYPESFEKKGGAVEYKLKKIKKE